MKRTALKRKTELKRAGFSRRITATDTESGRHREHGPPPATKGLASMHETPYGYCECGCGGKTTLARQTDKKYGWVKGEPVRFLPHHHDKSAASAVGNEKKRIAAGVPADAPRNKWGNACIERECAVCGKTFLAQWSQRLVRKTCSRACAAALKRGQHKDRRGAKNPNFRNGTRTGVRDREGERRWYVALETVDRCQAPECPDPTGGLRGLVLHHVCYRQHVRKAGGDEWDPANSLALCDSCHANHHGRGRVLPVACLREENLAYVRDLLGEAAGDYFKRYYGYGESTERKVAA